MKDKRIVLHNIPEGLHHKLKVIAAQEKVSLQELTVRILEKAVKEREG